MHQYEQDMAEMTRQHLAVYRERLEESRRKLDVKITELESKKIVDFFYNFKKKKKDN